MADALHSFGTDDQQLLEGLRRGDRTSWQHVYVGNKKRIVNYLRGLGATDKVAAEIYQDTMVFLDTKKDTLILSSKLSTYLTGVAIRKLKEYWSKQTTDTARFGGDVDYQLRRQPVDEEEGVELALLRLAAEDDMFVEFDRPVEADELVQQALARLSLKNCISIFQLRYWDGLSDRQIAQRLGLSYGSLRNQRSDCKEQMRTILLSMGWGH